LLAADSFLAFWIHESHPMGIGAAKISTARTGGILDPMTIAEEVKLGAA